MLGEWPRPHGEIEHGQGYANQFELNGGDDGTRTRKKWNRSKKPTNGAAQIRFKPVEKAEPVKAFAISLEGEGGVPKKEGPILLVGTT